MAATVVLDTHVWLWWAAMESRLSAPARDAIAGAETIGIAAISCWEVAMLVTKRRIELDRVPAEWVRLALARPGVRSIPLDPPIALAAADLERSEAPPDPADRMIYATARSLGAPLITKDQALRDFDPRGTLW